ncbi:MAG: mechanosensitive ion channel [Flavobacteriales bacterium]|nr:mechanosensitive ion channel [Flavobacteriales bacterium]
METYRTQLVETAVCLFAFLFIRYLGKYIIRNAVVRASFKAKEEKEVMRLLNLLIFLVLAVILTAIWGVKQSEILLFATSVITVLGVAFFAEMSILSNVTACIVLFFQHPVKIGDTIKVLDDQHKIEGELIDITYFFVFIRTADRGTITIPNSVLLKSPFYIVGSSGTDGRRAADAIQGGASGHAPGRAEG